MTYDETIEWLYRQLPMFSRIGAAAYKEDLHNTYALCNFAGNPQNKFKSIHIAGTNGKGSTSHMLAAIFQQAGYKTGLYTSPHIKDFRERIRINGQMIGKEFITSFVDKIKPACEEINPSFFELTVAMAFEYFAIEKVDIAIIETGLGGRLDSTNIITPELSVITNIGYDHTQFLGNTLSAIAFEKAGIIKRNIPVVIGESNTETRPVFTGKAEEMNAPIFFAENEFIISKIHEVEKGLNCALIQQENNSIQSFQLDLPGLYQQYNLRTVLTACKVLNQHGYHLPDDIISDALQKVRLLTGLRGRWEIIGKDPLTILDVGHNEDGFRAILSQLKSFYPNATLHFVLGFVQDKDISKVLSLFNPKDKYYFTQAHIPRALPCKELRHQAAENKLSGNCYENVNEALASAKACAGKDDVIMVCGSFFTIAELDDY